MIRGHLIKQMRSSAFLAVIAINLLLGYACVPASSAGYEVFYIGGVRGIYDSAWLGSMAAMLSAMLLWLFGFYMLRSQVSEDARLQVGQIIAATPVSKLRYLTMKAVSNYVVLLVLALLFAAAFMFMQLLRGEDRQLELWGYAAPMLFITVPSFILLAAITVVFDAIPGMKGTLGNILFFVLWLAGGAVSMEATDPAHDLFGIHVVLSHMAQDAAAHFPHLPGIQDAGSFGYYKVAGETPVFRWEGVPWGLDLLLSRMVWLLAAGCLLLLAAVVFDRFAALRLAVKPSFLPNAAVRDNQPPPAVLSAAVKSGVPMGRLVLAELTVMLRHIPKWWTMLLAAAAVTGLLIPPDRLQGWLPLLMLVPLPVWSQMGTKETYYSTKELAASSCSSLRRRCAAWMAGIVVSMIAGSGVLVRYMLDGQWEHVLSWGTGSVFVPTLALALGSIGGTRKAFEVLYLIWWYAGPMSRVSYLDFLGISAGSATIYVSATLVMLLYFLIQGIRKGNLPKWGIVR
ncbi:hypothetical protein ACFFK0_13685 [Paenibacillus chartarius]|uniref:ABC transporter permease n=1 Tax=Paenibacillus chartarius TaxID=747481 RepID=A0ABV6DLH5_9BACL